MHLKLKRFVGFFNFAVMGFLFFPALAGAHVTMTTDGEYRYIKSDGVPEHATGQFPNAHNPNTIAEQDYNFRVAFKPKLSGQVTPVHGQPFGVAIDGVVFDPGTAEFYNNDRSWNYEAKSGKIDLGLDEYNAHVQPSGAYHYHGIPKTVAERSGLVGYAADGFPIYIVEGVQSSYSIKKGTRPGGPGGAYDGTFTADYEYVKGSGALDECNGINDQDGNYIYVLTDTFPYIPRCWKGAPDQSFERHGGLGPMGQGQKNGMGNGKERMGQGMGGGQQGMGKPPRPPQEAIDACGSKSEGSACGFESPHGSISGQCAQLGGTLACRPEGGPPGR